MMFRDKLNTKLLPELFSVGSIIRENKNDKGYLVIGSSDAIKLLNLTTFNIVDMGWICVKDINFLSSTEVRELVHDLNWAFSDYDYIAEGLK